MYFKLGIALYLFELICLIIVSQGGFFSPSSQTKSSIINSNFPLQLAVVWFTIVFVLAAVLYWFSTRFSGWPHYSLLILFLVQVVVGFIVFKNLMDYHFFPLYFGIHLVGAIVALVVTLIKIGNLAPS